MHLNFKSSQMKMDLGFFSVSSITLPKAQLIKAVFA